MAAPGVTLTPAQIASFKYQQEHITDDRRGVIIGACSALWALALVALCLRFYAKKIVRSKYEHDDGLIILGFLASSGVVLANTLATRYGAGRHMLALSVSDIETGFKHLFAFNLCYGVAITAIKGSVLVFYYRIFKVSRGFRIAVWCMAAFAIAWYLTVLFTTIFRCIPITDIWSVHPTGRCINFSGWLVSTAVFNVLSDLAVLIMPMPLIWKLQLPMQNKIGVSIVFFLGGIAVLASIFRLVALANLDINDWSYNSVDAGIWSVVEPLVGLIGACLPLMTPLFRQIRDISARITSSANSEEGWAHGLIEEGRPATTKKHALNDNDVLAGREDWAEIEPKLPTNHTFVMRAVSKGPDPGLKIEVKHIN